MTVDGSTSLVATLEIRTEEAKWKQTDYHSPIPDGRIALGVHSLLTFCALIGPNPNLIS